jgi:hypothetical protein
MFVRLLAWLISNVLVCFSVLWCCRSFQIADKRVKKAKGEDLAPASALEPKGCDRAYASSVA